MEVFAGLDLARRLERAEGVSSAEFVEARARMRPALGACWREIEGAYALFDGVYSPITQTFGLGMFQQPDAGGIDALEAFFQDRGAPVAHEVSPLAGVETARLLAGRGYQPVEFTSVMFREIAGPRRDSPGGDVRVRMAGEGEGELYARIAARGWSDSTEFADLIFDLALVGASRANAASFVAEVGGVPAAAGSLTISDGVALLAGASTVPEHRKRGAQFALLEARLGYAAERGCDLAMMCAAPGSASQRNAERHGFRIAYTRIKWQLESGRLRG